MKAIKELGIAHFVRNFLSPDQLTSLFVSRLNEVSLDVRPVIHHEKRKWLRTIMVGQVDERPVVWMAEVNFPQCFRKL